MCSSDELIDRLISMCDIQHDLIAEIEDAASYINQWDSSVYGK